MATIPERGLSDPRVKLLFRVLDDHVREQRSLDSRIAMVSYPPSAGSDRLPASRFEHRNPSAAVHCWPRGYPAYDDL